MKILWLRNIPTVNIGVWVIDEVYNDGVPMFGSFGFRQTRRKMAHLMNWCDFGEEFTSTPDDSFHPPPGSCFFQEDMALLEEIHITPVATDRWGFLDRLCRTWPHG